MLIEEGADLNGRATALYAALYEAARKGHLACARHLLDAGCDVNAPIGVWKPTTGLGGPDQT